MNGGVVEGGGGCGCADGCGGCGGGGWVACSCLPLCDLGMESPVLLAPSRKLGATYLPVLAGLAAFSARESDSVRLS